MHHHREVGAKVEAARSKTHMPTALTAAAVVVSADPQEHEFSMIVQPKAIVPVAAVSGPQEEHYWASTSSNAQEDEDDGEEDTTFGLFCEDLASSLESVRSSLSSWEPTNARALMTQEEQREAQFCYNLDDNNYQTD